MSLVVKLEDDLGERSEWVILHGVVPQAKMIAVLINSSAGGGASGRVGARERSRQG